MNNSNKEQIGSDVICRNHSARTERDLYRLCPSKLSKHELEDLYFALLENNLDLKKTVNVLQDRIKVLTTKIQRMSAVQKNTAGKEKDCCASKTVVNEQKENMTALKKTNERMAERIRMLNMRLCSAKQFVKRSPSQANNSYKTCTRCSFKNSSLCILNAKVSDGNVRTTAVSCQFLDKNLAPGTTRTVETETAVPEKDNAEMSCNENKCRTMMDELKEKIVNLQEELSTSHDDYSQRIAKLECQVLELHGENIRVRSDHATSEHALQRRVQKADQLQEKLRTSDAKYNELNMELSIEKRKVAELETGLKVANMSNHVVKTIEQMAATKEEKQEPLGSVREISFSSFCSQMAVDPKSPSYKIEESTPPSIPASKVEVKLGDDSGCTDLNKSCETVEDQTMVKMNKELMKRIAELQTKLDLLRIASAGNTVQKDEPNEFESYDVETKGIDETQNNEVEDAGYLFMDAAEPNVERSNSRKQVAVSDERIPHEKYDESVTYKPWEEFLTADSSNMGDDVKTDTINQKSVSNAIMKNKSDTKFLRDDTDNRYQIPGPIPVAYPAPTTDKSNIYKSNQSKDSYKKPKSKRSCSKDSYFYCDEKPVDGNSTAMNEEKELIKEDKSLYARIPDAGVELGPSPSRDAKKIQSRSAECDIEPMDEVMKESTMSFLKVDSKCTPAPIPDRQAVEQAAQAQPPADAYELCESRATICRCPALARPRPDVSVLRSCSGTLRVRMPPARDGLRHCACELQTRASACQVDPSPPACRRDSATYTANVPNTYTVQVDKCSRATSPENTEREISSLTDLPSERDAKSPRVLSPGEKATMTYTDTGNNTDGYGSLSEGEMPITAKGQKFSAREKSAVSRNSLLPITSSEKMEATLKSISDELARCRELLLSQKTQQRDAAQVSKPPDELNALALHHSVANRRISDTQTPSCVFTLHIGTLVLSDEAVLFSHDKSLVLKWKFYSQSAAMTRVQAGRVVTFDFVTEYDVVFNEEFLEYMKNVNMMIALCELEKEDQPFATCSLPLREALLHANRRADMSLALVPLLPQGAARDSIGEEIGVLDLWCSLRVDFALLSPIYQAMCTLSPPDWVGTEPSESRVIQQAVEEERVSQDFPKDMNSNIRVLSSTPDETSRKFSPISAEDDHDIARDPSGRYDDEVQKYRPTKLYRRRSSQTQKCNLSSLRRESSGTITNEVPANIKSTDEMKQALQRNVQQNNVPILPKMDDEAFHAHSSIGSMRSLAARHQLSKLRWPKKRSSKDNVDSLEDLLKKDKESLRNTGISRVAKPVKKSVNYTDGLSRHGSIEEKERISSVSESTQSIDITVLWLALNEECEAMVNPNVHRLYVAYSFLGRRGAELETPYSLPKPRHYADKCFFNFKKTFVLNECDLPLLGHMSRCRAGTGASTDPRDCIVFTLVSEPPEDPLGLSSCEDIGYAYLYLGDVVAYSGGGGGYTQVVGVLGARGGVCGVLAVRVDNLRVLRRCLALSPAHREPSAATHSSMIPMFEIE